MSRPVAGGDAGRSPTKLCPVSLHIQDLHRLVRVFVIHVFSGQLFICTVNCLIHLLTGDVTSCRQRSVSGGFSDRSSTPGQEVAVRVEKMSRAAQAHDFLLKRLTSFLLAAV